MVVIKQNCSVLASHYQSFTFRMQDIISICCTVFRYIMQLSKEGSAINRHIVKATANGVLQYHIPRSYKSIELTDGWARSLLERMNLVKRKGKNQN